MFICNPLPETATRAISWSTWIMPSRRCGKPCGAAGTNPVWYSTAAPVAGKHGFGSAPSRCSPPWRRLSAATWPVLTGEIPPASIGGTWAVWPASPIANQSGACPTATRPGSNSGPASCPVATAAQLYQIWLQRLRIPQRFPQPDWSIADKWVAQELLRRSVPPATVASVLQGGSPGFPRRHADPTDYLRRTLARAWQELSGTRFPPPGGPCVDPHGWLPEGGAGTDGTSS